MNLHREQPFSYSFNHLASSLEVYSVVSFRPDFIVPMSHVSNLNCQSGINPVLKKANPCFY
jgi:hypothetical protein